MFNPTAKARLPDRAFPPSKAGQAGGRWRDNWRRGKTRDSLLDSKEAAEMLGVAPATLRNKARRHEILRVQTNGRQCLFRLADVIEYRDKKTS